MAPPSGSSRRPSLFAPRPQQSASDTGVSHPALLKLFSSLKRKATLLVHTPSSLPSLPTPPDTNQRSYPFKGKFSKSKRRQLKEFQRLPTPAILRRPPTAQCSPMMLSMRAHGLANYPRPPKIRTVRRPNSSRRHVPSSSTSSATSASSHHACRRKPVPAPLEMGDSTSTLVASEPKTPLTPDQEKIARLQDQIIALQRALSPTPPSLLDNDVAAKPPSYTRQSQSQDLEVEKPSLIQTVKRSSLLVPLTPSRPSSSSSKKSKRSSFGARRDAEEIDNPMDMAAAIEELASKWDRSKREAVYDPFAKDTVEIVHALPGFSTSVSLRRQVNARSRPVSEAFTISGVSNTARDVLSTFSVETPPPVPTLPPLENLGSGRLPRTPKRNSIITLGQSMVAPPASPLPAVPTLPSPVPELKEDEATSVTDNMSTDWTLFLGALDYYVDMNASPSRPSKTETVEKSAPTPAPSPAPANDDWTLHVPPPKYSFSRTPSKSRSNVASATPVRESYLDMTDPERWPSPPPSPSPTPSRSVRSRTKPRHRANADADKQSKLLSPLSLMLPQPSQSPDPISPISLSPSSTLSPSPLAPKLLSVSPPPSRSRSHRRSPSILSFASTTSFSTTASTSTLGQRASRFFRMTLGKEPREEEETSSGWF